MNHPCAAQVADYACIAMEDCAGGSLLDHVASGVPFPLPAVVEVTRQCATGLALCRFQTFNPTSMCA